MKPLLIPKPVSMLLTQLPQRPHAILFTQAINFALKDRWQDEVWSPLHGKQLCIRIRDAGIALHFTLGPSGLSPRQAAPADLTISASLQDFVLLGLRKEDPDTLFFSRRLVMEGDTELGLLVKNTLDSFEFPQPQFKHLLPGHILGLIKTRLLA